MPARKSPAQLDSDVVKVVGKKIDRKKLGEMMGPWGSDFSYGEGSGAVGAVSSYYFSGKKYPERRWVERALRAIEADIPRAQRGESGWTKADARNLRTIAAGLRYYLVQDYGGSSHATRRGRRSHAAIKADDRYTAKQRAAQAEIKLDAIPTREWSRERVMAVLRDIDTEALRVIEHQHLIGAGIFTAGRQVAKWARDVLDERGEG